MSGASGLTGRLVMAAMIDEMRARQIFDHHVAPFVAELDRERRRLLTELLTRLGLLAAAALTFLALSDSLAVPTPFVLAVVLGGGAMAALLLHRLAARRYRSLIRGRVMPPVCAALGGLHHTDEPEAGFDLERFRRLGLIGSLGTSRRLEDRFTGHHRGTKFDMVEAEIVRRSGRHRSTVFRGLLFSIGVPIGFRSEVVIALDYGRIGNALGAVLGAGRGRTRILFDHAAFERLYAAFAADEVEARRLLTPDFLDAMVALATSHRGSALKAAFSGGRFLLALPLRRDLFEVGGLFKPAAGLKQELHRLIDEIGIAHRLIDFLHGDRPGRLA